MLPFCKVPAITEVFPCYVKKASCVSGLSPVWTVQVRISVFWGHQIYVMVSSMVSCTTKELSGLLVQERITCL